MLTTNTNRSPPVRQDAAPFRRRFLSQGRFLCSVWKLESQLKFYGRHGGRPLRKLTDSYTQTTRVTSGILSLRFRSIPIVSVISLDGQPTQAPCSRTWTSPSSSTSTNSMSPPSLCANGRSVAMTAVTRSRSVCIPFDVVLTPEPRSREQELHIPARLITSSSLRGIRMPNLRPLYRPNELRSMCPTRRVFLGSVTVSAASLRAVGTV